MSGALQGAVLSRRTRALGLIIGAVVGVGLLAVDAERAQHEGPWLVVGLAVGAAVVGLTLLALDRADRWRWLLAAALVSLVTSATLLILSATGRAPALLSIDFPIAELMALAGGCALTTAKLPVPSAGVVLAVGLAALVGVSLRQEATWPDAAAVLLVGALAALVGLYLRLLTQGRRRAAETAAYAERLALARDLHDHSAHSLTGLLVQVQGLRRVAQIDPTAVTKALPRLEEAGRAALDDLRRLTDGLRHPSTEPADSAAHLATELAEVQARARRAGLPVSMSVDRFDYLGPMTAHAVQSLVTEGVTNALRYARNATRVRVEVVNAGSEVRVAVVDDGAGDPVLAPERIGGGDGLPGLRERVTGLGGSFSAGSTADGWAVRARLPLGGPT